MTDTKSALDLEYLAETIQLAMEFGTREDILNLRAELDAAVYRKDITSEMYQQLCEMAGTTFSETFITHQGSTLIRAFMIAYEKYRGPRPE